MLKKLVKQFNTAGKIDSPISSPAEELKKESRNSFLRGLSKHALNLYVKKSDIKNFTKLALSNPEDKSHNKLVEELDIIDPWGDDLFDLANNENFLKDLGL